MTLRARGRRWRFSPTVFDLEIRNEGPEPVELELSAASPEENAPRFELPERAHVPAGGTTVVELRARGRRRRWLGAVLPIAFSAEGTPPGAGPPASVSGTFEDAPLGWPILSEGLLGAGAVCAAAAGGIFLAMGGGSDDGGDAGAAAAAATEIAVASESATASGGNVAETATETATNTPRPTATRTPTGTPTGGSSSSGQAATSTTAPTPAQPTATPTNVPATPTSVPSTATSVPPTATPLPIGIAAGDWFYDFLVVENTCPFGENVNEFFTVSFTLAEVGAADGFIAVGDPVDITEFGTGAQVGRFTFSYPFFQWFYPVTASGFTGQALLQNEYFDAQSGSAVLTEVYPLAGGGECMIVGEE